MWVRYEASFDVFPSSLPGCVWHWMCFLCHTSVSLFPARKVTVTCLLTPAWPAVAVLEEAPKVAGGKSHLIFCQARRTLKEDPKLTSFLGYCSQLYNKDSTVAHWSPNAVCNSSLDVSVTYYMLWSKSSGFACVAKNNKWERKRPRTEEHEKENIVFVKSKCIWMQSFTMKILMKHL